MPRTTVCRTSYAVSVTIRQFKRIEKRDESASDYGLLTKLQDAGAHSIEYNGHFGAYVYYTLHAEDDTPEKRAEIETLVINYAEGRRT